MSAEEKELIELLKSITRKLKEIQQNNDKQSI